MSEPTGRTPDSTCRPDQTVRATTDPPSGLLEIVECDDVTAYLYGSEEAARAAFESLTGDGNLVTPRGGWGVWAVEVR